MLTALTGCSKYSVECELVVQPYVMITAGSDIHTPGYMVRVYAFYLEKAQEYLEDPDWRPGSYADAEAGLIRNIVSGEVRAHNLVGYQEWGDGTGQEGGSQNNAGENSGGDTEEGDEGTGEEGDEGTGEEGPGNEVGGGGDGFVHLTLTKSPVLLVALDPVNKFYAWRLFKYEAPLERIFVPVSFKIYQKDPYEENEWRVISLEREQNPAQEEEGEE